MLLRSLALTATAAEPARCCSRIGSLDMSMYRLDRTFALPATATAAAIAYNWDRGTVFMLAASHGALLEVTRTGMLVSSMSLRGCGERDGLTYVGNGCFVLTEEQLQHAYLLRYAPGAAAAQESLPCIALGPAAAAERSESIDCDLAARATLPVSAPWHIHVAGMHFGAGTRAVANLFAPILGVSVRSDARSLAVMNFRPGERRQDATTDCGRRDSRALSVLRGTAALSAYDFAAGPSESAAHGPVAMSDPGDELPRLFVMTPAPDSSAVVLMAAIERHVVRRQQAIVCGAESP